MPLAVVVLMLTLLLGIQPVSTDLYLPALPTLQHDLHATLAAAQMTLSAPILCFGVSQLVWGPLADRFGRRPVLLAGLALYTVASLFCALAASIDALVAWRAVQGAAMAAAVTRGRSVVRDLYLPHEGAWVLSRALSGLGVMQATRLRPLLHNWGVVLRNPTFRAWVALLCCTWGGLFFLLAGSSFVFINVLGTSKLAYGAILATSSVAYVAGTWLCRLLLLRHGLRGTVRRGAVLSLAGGLSMAALSLAGVESVWAIMLPQWLFALGHGIHQPCGQAGAVGSFPDMAGTAVSLSGLAMMLTAFGVSPWLGHTLDHSVLPLTLGVGLFSVLLAGVALTLVQRHGDPRPRPHPHTHLRPAAAAR